MAIPSVDVLRQSHRLLAEYQYEILPVVHGYANRTLYINLSEMRIQSKPGDRRDEKNLHRWQRIWIMASVECYHPPNPMG